MDAPRRTLSIGPVSISIRRRVRDDDVPHVGPIASPLIHVIVLALAFLLTEKHAEKQHQEEIAKAKERPVTITFVNPSKPPPKPPAVRPAPSAPKVDLRRIPPPPASTKPLRMQPAPDSVAALKSSPKDAPNREAGRHDTRPAGGTPGGPLPTTTPGVPDPGSAGRETDAERGVQPADKPADLEGRLRSFQRALEEPKPPSPKGPKGGGGGTGGISMPNMPETGFGVGNLEFEGRDYDWAEYGRQIYWEILRAWYRRLLADSGVFERWASERRTWELDHKAGIHFTILRSGQVVDIGVEAASGCYPLDDSAREALQEVVLPPLPPDFQRESETVHARFIAEGPIQGMRTQLQQLHDYGFF